LQESAAPPGRIPIWDVPVRLFHWVLALLVVFSFVTGKVGGYWLEWHMRSGFCILTLLAFRIAWGIVGSDTARFTQFVRGPAAGLAYAREVIAKRKPVVLGHNPLGGWMVVAMLALLATQAFSGLFVDDEISTQGPLAVKVSNAFVSRMSTLHHFNSWLVAGAVVLHVSAIAYYYWGLGSNLVAPMLHGGASPGDVQRRAGSSALAAVLLAIAAAAVYYLVIVYPKSS
jgi:cytochrome b